MGILKPVIKWGVADAILLLALYGVHQDQVWRSSCQASIGCLSQVSSVSYSILTMVTSLVSTGVPRQSPLTLDWLQVILAVLLVLNAYVALTWLRRRPIPASRSVQA